jgi:hypothetical protein
MLMPNTVDSKYFRVSPTAEILAEAYLPILIHLAMTGGKLQYGELVAHAKQQNPNIDAVQKAIAITAGKILSVIRDFTNSEGLPDLSSLIVSKKTGECASNINTLFDPVEERKRVYATDWSLIINKFKLYIVVINELASKEVINNKPKRLPKPKGITEVEAREMMWDYYQKNNEALDPKIKTKADFIVSLIMKGVSVEEAFKQALESIGG